MSDDNPAPCKTRRANVARRLARIEGQVRGLSKMIDEDRYCIDVLTQIKAVQAALKRAEGELLKDHADHCLAAAIASDDITEREAKVSELIDLLSKR
jgi:DNA-binding FrmR family transcriptional regulator